MPLWRYGKTAQSVGTKAERKRTRAVIRDLRVLLHSVELLFVRANEPGRALMDAYRQELEGGGDYSSEWRNNDPNPFGCWVGGKGWQSGRRTTVEYSGTFNSPDNGYLAVYGWTHNPSKADTDEELVEYYIVDSWGSWRPPGSSPRGTVESDGGTYEIYQNSRTGPSIEGNTTFQQYWSVRTEKRESGTITVGNHFAAWEANGMNMGSLHEVSMNVEGYQSSGNADVRMVIR